VELANKKVLVLGAGKSGISSAKFLRERGAVVGIFDDGEPECIKEAVYVRNQSQIEVEDFDFCVISPGVSMNHPVAQKFEGRIISELALGFSSPHKKIVAVTGTNGKTTVTNMIGEAVGDRGIICGNIGIPVTSVATEIAKKTAVTEVSSFMLETDSDFSADIGVILNITQDHLERHGTMEEYIRCKGKLAGSKQVVLNYDDLNCRVLNDGRAYYFSTKSAVRGVYLEGDEIILNIKRKKAIFKLSEFREDRPHQISNILAVVLVCKLLGVRRKDIIKACTRGEEREHRIQPVGTVGNITFVNDSKATNIAATLAACRCFQGPVNLLVGGMLKGQNATELFENLPSHIDQVFAFGKSADEIMDTAVGCGFVRISKHKRMADAVRAATVQGLTPKVVLLSPACSSFDEFNGYSDRGNVFAQIVKKLMEEDSAYDKT
jgi:UDP-N-acetylmuramoylalanine--D-glutamate ligase